VQQVRLSECWRIKEYKLMIGADLFPLSAAQKQIWIVDRLQGKSPEFNLQSLSYLEGSLDERILGRAVQAIIERHESLRSHFHESEGRIFQIYAPKIDTCIGLEEIGTGSATEQNEQIEKILTDEVRPMNLADCPQLRFKLIKLGDREHIFVRTVHHLVWDAWSEGIFNYELRTLYQTYLRRQNQFLPDLKAQYRDYVCWERQHLADHCRVAAALQYYGTGLANPPCAIKLPTDRKRMLTSQFAAGICSLRLSSDLADSLKALSRVYRTTIYMTLLAIFVTLLVRYTGQEDFVIGTPFANRRLLEFESLIGLFVSRLVLRIHARLDMRFQELLNKVREIALEAYRHQSIPIARVMSELGLANRSMPLFQVVFAFQRVPWTSLQLENLQVSPYPSERRSIRADLEVHCYEDSGTIETRWLYRRELFDEWRIQKMACHFERIARGVIANVDQRIDQLEMLRPNRNIE
jgi:hypothetical protein